MDKDTSNEDIGDRHIQLANIAVEAYRELDTGILFSTERLLALILDKLLPDSEIQSDESLAVNRKTKYYRCIKAEEYTGVAQFLTICWMHERGDWNHEQTDKVLKDIIALLKSENVANLYIHRPK